MYLKFPVKTTVLKCKHFNTVLLTMANFGLEKPVNLRAFCNKSRSVLESLYKENKIKYNNHVTNITIILIERNDI